MAFYTKRLKIVAIIPFCSQECPVYFSNPLTQYLKGKDSQVVLFDLNFWISQQKGNYFAQFSHDWLWILLIIISRIFSNNLGHTQNNSLNFLETVMSWNRLFPVCLTFNPIILHVYYSCTLIEFICKEEVITFTDWQIKTKRILELKPVQIQVQIIQFTEFCKPMPTQRCFDVHTTSF